MSLKLDESTESVYVHVFKVSSGKVRKEIKQAYFSNEAGKALEQHKLLGGKLIKYTFVKEIECN